MQAVSLVSLVDGKLVVPPEAEATLSQMKEPLTVAAFCGRYRGGKSSLLSRLAGSPAFRLGHSVNACTKGTRFATLGPSPGDANGGGKRVLLLDTEGLCATDSDATHDTQIFACKRSLVVLAL
jgi:ribosome biogenesis GTPase A